MASRIEDYGLIGDGRTSALIARDGSIDWLCLPRQDSGACFASLLGTEENGRWQIAPCAGKRTVTRAYHDGTLVLETRFTTEDGEVALIDFMPLGQSSPTIVRIVKGIRGRVPMRMQLVIRFDYGSVVPWVRMIDGVLRVVGGPDGLYVTSTVPMRGEGLTTVAELTVAEGESVPFVMTWRPSHEPAPPPVDPFALLAETVKTWRAWSEVCTYRGEHRAAVVRSLVTLKALTNDTTGGILAAPTTSLPEQLGGPRNWDYRFCWLRDATFTLYALLHSGYRDEACAWREWLLRAVAGAPDQLQIMYGVAGERRLTELELPWLAGYEGSRPVRIGNAAVEQTQLDVYGEILDAMHQSTRFGLAEEDHAWQLQLKLLEHLEGAWQKPDEGIWEVRGPAQQFTHSKVMAWVAFDRAVKSIESFGCKGPVDRFRALRDAVHAEVCSSAFDGQLGSFVQSYGSKELDASLLMIPLVGFLPATDVRVRGTIAAIERNLVWQGFVLRYATESGVDGLPPGEGAFLPCTFWLADALTLLGRTDDARVIFDRASAVRNDLGLFSEEFDPRAGRLLGNFPQAFTHVSHVNSALNLGELGPAKHRQQT